METPLNEKKTKDKKGSSSPSSPRPNSSSSSTYPIQGEKRDKEKKKNYTVDAKPEEDGEMDIKEPKKTKEEKKSKPTIKELDLQKLKKEDEVMWFLIIKTQQILPGSSDRTIVDIGNELDELDEDGDSEDDFDALDSSISTKEKLNVNF
jgi:hypothetical protein